MSYCASMQHALARRILRPPGTLLLLGLTLSGCESLDGLSVGRTDRLESAPHYVTYEAVATEHPIVTLPVTIDPVSGEPFNIADRKQALEPLIDALNRALGQSSCCQFIASPDLPEIGAPLIYVGSVDGDYAPAGTGIEQQDHAEYPPMILNTTKPSADWTSALTALAHANGARRVLIVQLAFAQYPKADKGFFGKKVVLGTGYEEDIRFLSAIDKPVEVLQLTGMLLASDGTILRAGAEGIVGHDAPFIVQIFDAGQDIDTSAIEYLLEDDRRDDLPGRPLKWKAALDQLLKNLTTQPSMAPI